MDYQDVALEAQAKFAQQFQAHVAKVMEPIIKRQLKMQWAMTGEDVKERIKQEDPEAYEKLLAAIRE